MEEKIKTSISETQSTDTALEMKPKLNDDVDVNHPEKKAKPPPLDVCAVQDLQQVTMTDAKSPSNAANLLTSGPKKLKERKLGHRRVDEEGQITFKKIQTSHIMGSIQLGIGNAVGSLASKPERDLLMQDFTIVEMTTFPHDGSNLAPAHHYRDFKFRSYAPVAFRFFRDLFGIQPDDFLLSLCNFPMRELTNPGASGSIFYLTDDDEFIIKTVQHKEAIFLQKLLPGYYMNLNQNPRTLLPKFFGLYCYQCGGKNVRLIVMNNLLPSFINLHEKYDLKGSTYKRKANKKERRKSSPTYKDLDFMEFHSEGILLEADTYNALMKTMQRDCRVLESFKIMDYSLLVGIHNLDLAKREKLQQKEEEVNGKLSANSDSACSPIFPCEKSESGLVRSRSMNRQRLAAFSSAMESIQVEVESTADDEDILPGGIPARNSKGDRLLLFLGIIDILQSFQLTKKLEHTFKSVIHDGDTVSVHRPSFYAQRFLDFMSRTVFKKVPPSLKLSPSKKKCPIANKSFAISETEMNSQLSKIPSESEYFEDGSILSEPISSFSEIDHVNLTTDIQGESTWIVKERANTYPASPQTTNTYHSGNMREACSVTWEKEGDSSLSQVTTHSEVFPECLSQTSSSSKSTYRSSISTATWTPPYSVGNSTPTHTEGTPSFTESSSSTDAVCFNTPTKSINKSTDSLPLLGETLTMDDREMTRL